MSKEEIEELAEILAERIASKLSERAQRRYLSRDEFAKSRGLGVRTVDRAIAENRLAVERVGRRIMIPTDATIAART